jgi:hypothetical protein
MQELQENIMSKVSVVELFQLVKKELLLQVIQHGIGMEILDTQVVHNQVKQLIELKP